MFKGETVIRSSCLYPSSKSMQCFSLNLYLNNSDSKYQYLKICISFLFTDKSLSEALIFASTNPKYDDRFFIELQVQYMKIPSSNLGRTCCVLTIFVHNMFSNLPLFCKKEELLTKNYLWRINHDLSFYSTPNPILCANTLAKCL